MANRWGKIVRLYFLGSKITVDGDCSHEIKRRLLLGRKVMSNLDSILKSRDISLPTKVHLAEVMVFPVVMYGYESCTIKKAEFQRTDAFALWCWRLLRVPWSARRASQSILKEINLEYSLEELMLKLRLHTFGHLMPCVFCQAQSCLTLCNPMDCNPPGSSGPGGSPGKNTGMCCHIPLQRIFPTQGLNSGLSHCRLILYHLSHHLMQKVSSLEKTLVLGKIWRQEEKGSTEEEMVGWHHRLNGHEFEQAPQEDGQGSLACCSPCGHKESDTTERLYNKMKWMSVICVWLLITP